MNLDELRSVQSKERQTDSLQHLRESFYEDVSAYVSELEERRDRAAEAADDPFADPEVRRLTDEIETAREVVEAIYERRLGKLVKRASLAAADMPADEEGLTAEERELFEDLVDRIETNKAHVLDVLDADAPAEAGAGRDVDTTGSRANDADAADTTAPPEDRTAGATGTTTDEAAATDAGPHDAAGTAAPAGDGVAGAADEEDRVPEEARAVASPEEGDDRHGGATGGTGEQDEAREPPADGRQPDGGARAATPGLDDRTTVRITGDVGEFYGVDDREYDLEDDDVVALPAANAEPLLQSGDAERVD